MKLSVDQTRLILFVVALLCATLLVAMGKLDPKMLGAFVPWLLPSPVIKDAVQVEKSE